MYNLPDMPQPAAEREESTAQSAVSSEPEISAASVAEPIGAAKSLEDEGNFGLALPPSQGEPSSPIPGSEAPVEEANSDSAELADVAAATSKLEIADGAEEQGEARALTREEEIEEALNCPCIDAMREGPCGDQFLSAYRCFLESDSEPKGMDCVDRFATMQGCMAEHPDEYGVDEDGVEEAGEGPGNVPGDETESELSNGNVSTGEATRELQTEHVPSQHENLANQVGA